MADGLTQTNEIASKTQRKQERDGSKPDGLTQTNEIASKTYREQERDGAKPDGLTLTNEIASKSQKVIWSYLDNLITDKWMD